ncbi:MAG: helix-turn-helix transcriptional regulator [Lachnospiraceae bacterium]|nr:helix-turn-helix transcriptional regulator [Lachnospiraceae bacterium]
MLLKEYCKLRKVSIRQIAMNAHIPYSTLNDLVNQKTDADRAAFGMICALADELKISLDELRQMLSADSLTRADGDGGYAVVVRNKSYYIDIVGEGREYLCKVNPVTTFSIDDIAFWKYRDHMVQKKMEEINDLCFNAQE